MVLEDGKELGGQPGPVDTALAIPLGHANVMREGTDLTIVTWSRGVAPALQALEHEALRGVSVEVIDLRTLWPWDQATVHASAAKTGRLLVVHEAVQVAGFGAEIAAHTDEATGCRVARLGSPRIPVGYAQVLENEARLSPEKIAHAAKTLLDRS